MTTTPTNRMSRIQRHKRIRSRVSGTAERPRLSIYKSNRYIHAQIINDDLKTTLVAGSTTEFAGVRKSDAAVALGRALAQKAQAAGITAVVFDRGGFRYTGRVAALAEATREGGLKF